MTRSQHAMRPRGFSLIELMVTIAIVAIGITLAVPYFGGAATTARQRSIVDRMVQDFGWARTAAGVADASTLGIAGVTGTPTVTVTLTAQTTTNCSWTVQVNGVTDPVHSTTSAQMASLAPGITCGVATDTLTLPVTFNLDTQGFISQTGTISYSSTQSGAGVSFWPLMFLSSGAVLNTNAAS